MLFFNKNSDKLVIVYFPPGAGGNFLINCLALNNDAYFSNEALIKDQLNGKFTVADKISYLHENLEVSTSTNRWADLSLGFGSAGAMEIDQIQDTNYPSLVDSRYVFVTSHEDSKVEHWLTKWSNAKVISFFNCASFVTWRKFLKPNWVKLWNELKGDSWPNMPRNLEEYDNLPEEVIKNMTSIVGGSHIHKYLRDGMNWWEKEDNGFWDKPQQFNTKNIYYWDNDWYFSEDKTIEQIKQLYSLFSLSNFNEPAIRDYYRQWVATLEKLSNLDK